MATLTPEQRQAIIDRGLQPSAFEKMDQAKVDKYFPVGGTTPAPAPSVTPAPVPVVPTPVSATPVSRPVKAPVSPPITSPLPAPTIAPATQPAPAQAVPTGPIYPFVPPPTPDLQRNVSTGPSLLELANRYVASRSKTPEGKVDPELEKEARAKAETILQTSFTPGGEANPITSLFASDGTDKSSIIEALKPQRIATAEEAYNIAQADFDASMSAISQIASEYDRDIQAGIGGEDLKTKRQQLETNPLGNSDFLLRKKQLLDYKQKQQEALYQGKTIPDFKADYADASVIEKVDAGIEQVLSEVGKKAMLANAGEGIIETPLGYSMRMLGAPVSAGIGAVKAMGEPTFGEAVATEIREGLGMMGVGLSIQEAATKAAGLNPDSNDPFITAARYLGGGAGLIVDFLLPIVPGAGSVSAAVRAGAQTARLEGALGAKTSQVARRAVANATKAGAGEAGRAVPFASRYISPEYGKDVYSQTITAYAKDADNIKSMEDLVGLSEDIRPQAFGKLDFEAKQSALKELFEDKYIRGNETFEDFLNRIEKVGDPYNPATYRDIKTKLPDMVKRATLDETLPVSRKEALARGSTFTTPQLAKDLVEYAIANDIDIGKLNIQDIDKFGGDLSSVLDSIGNKLYGADPGSLKEPAVIKQYLQDSANRQLTNTLVRSKTGGALMPDYTRLTRSSFLPTDQVPALVKQFEELVGDIRDKVVDATSKGQRTIELTDKELQTLTDLIGPTSLRSLPEAFNRTGLAEILPAKAGLPGGRLSVDKWNVIAELTMDSLASKRAGYKSVFDVSADIQGAKEGGFTFSAERYKQKVLTPKEVAGGTFESAVKTGVNKIVGQSDASPSSVLSTEFTDAVGQKWGSIPEDFKQRYRQNRAQGMTAPEAWSKTMGDNYLREAQPYIRELEDYRSTLGEEPDSIRAIDEEISRVKTDNYSQMFDDYVSMMYGGYESVIDAYNTTGRTQFIDGMLVPPFEMRKLTFILSQHPFIKEQRQVFLELMRRGKETEALAKLRDTHAIIQGRGITAFIPNGDALQKLYAAAKQADTNNILGNTPYQTGGALQGTRGIFEIWDLGKETAPMFLVDSHLELLSSQYLTRRQAGVVSEVYNDWADIMPELFPSPQGIDKNVSQFQELMNAYVSSTNEIPLLPRMAIENLKRMEVQVEIKRIVDPETGMVSEKNLETGETTRYDTTQTRTIKDIVDEIDIAGDVEYWFAITDRLIEDRKLATDLYVALVEDQLTRLSSSEAKPVKYNSVVKRITKEATDDFVANFLEKAEAQGYVATPALKKAIREYAEGMNTVYFYGPGKRYLDSFVGSSDYIQSIYPSLRQETTPLFFNTLKTAVRQAANSNIAVLTRGPLEQVSTIPLTFQETARVKKQLIQRGGIEAFTDAMDELAVASTARKIDEPLAKSAKDAIDVGLDITLDLRKQAKGAVGIQNRLANTISNVVGSPTSMFSDGSLSKSAKGGVLGGNILPNFRYLMTNYLTAPAIIYGSTGRVTTPFTVYRGDVMSSMSAMTGGGVGGVMDIRVSPKPTDVKVIVASPTGKVYTNYDIADMVASNSIARSQASAELTQQVMADIVSYSGVKQGEITKNVPGLNTIGRDQISQMLKQNFQPGSGRAMNIYQEAGNLTDTAFRTRVLIDALKEGKSEAEAITLAREALFDYGNLSQAEKDYISKFFWFWTFRRNSYRQVMKSFLTNPERLRNAYYANRYFAEMDREYNISTKDYAEYRPFIYLVNDKENKQRYASYGPSIPQLDATAQLIDYLSLGLPLLNDSASTGEKLAGLASGSVMKIGEMAGPVPQTAIGLAFGVDVRRDGQELGYGIDPRMMAYLTANEEMWSVFQSLINVEVVPPEEEKVGRGTYKGRQWRIKRGDTASVRNWFAIQQLMLAAGIQRNLRDYAPVIAPIQEGEVVPIQMGGAQEEGRYIQNWLYSAGVITPIEQPPLQDQIEYNKRALGEKFREGTYK